MPDESGSDASTNLYGTAGIGTQIGLDIRVPGGLRPGDGVVLKMNDGTVLHDGRPRWRRLLRRRPR